MDESSQLSRAVRLAEAGVVAYLVMGPVRALGRGLLFPDPGPVVPVLVATALYLPLLIMLLWPAVHGGRPAGAGWVLLGIAVIVVGTTAVGVGPQTGEMYGALGLAALLVLRVPWAWVCFLLAVFAPVPVTAVYGATFGFPRSDLSIVLFGFLSLAPYVLVRLVAAVRERDEARAALAAAAVVQERARIEIELGRTVGVELAAIVDRGERAGAPEQDDDAVEAQLRDLVATSRHALGRARRMISGYQRISLRSELDTAASLLRAAGVQTRVDAPIALAAGDDTDVERAALRAAVARLLQSGEAGSCVITLTSRPGEIDLEVTPGGARRTTTAATP